MLQRMDTGAPAGASLDETCASGRRVTTSRQLRSTLEVVLRTSPEVYGYPTYQGRFGWSVPKLLRCLEEKYGIEPSRSTLRRALAELDYDWRHKRWMPHRDDRGRTPLGRAVQEAR